MINRTKEVIKENKEFHEHMGNVASLNPEYAERVEINHHLQEISKSLALIVDLLERIWVK